MHLLWCPIIHIVTNLRPRTNKAHVAKEYINELWQLVELELTDKVPASRHARVVTTNSNKAPLVGPNPHRAELKNAEILVLKSYAHLAIKHRPLRVQLDPDGEQQKERTEHYQSQSTRYDVKRSFHEFFNISTKLEMT